MHSQQAGETDSVQTAWVSVQGVHTTELQNWNRLSDQNRSPWVYGPDLHLLLGWLPLGACCLGSCMHIMPSVSLWIQRSHMMKYLLESAQSLA